MFHYFTRLNIAARRGAKGYKEVSNECLLFAVEIM